MGFGPIEGQGTKFQTKMWWHLVKVKGMRELDLPKEYRNTVIARTKRGPLGRLVVKRLTGIQRTGPFNAIKQFEENVTGGKEDIAEKLEAVREQLPKEQLELLKMLKERPKQSLARIMAEAGVEPTQTMDLYARGAIVLGKVQAAIIAHNNLPGVVKDLVRHAIDDQTICDVCVGSGMTHHRAGGNKDTVKCPQCKGSGKRWEVSKHKEFAVQKILEVTKVVGSKDGINVNVQTNVMVGAKGSFMERMIKTSDEVLYSQKDAPVEAELVRVLPEKTE